MPKDRFPVNLADPKDIQEKLPQISQLLDAKRKELAALTTQVELLARLVGNNPPPVRERTGKDILLEAALRGRKAAPAQERAVQALERAGRPMGPTSLYNFMIEQGMEVPENANTLGANLWAAAKAGRIVKAPNGVYAPLGAPTDRPLTDYDAAAANGLPVPAKLPTEVEAGP